MPNNSGIKEMMAELQRKDPAASETFSKDLERAGRRSAGRSPRKYSAALEAVFRAVWREQYIKQPRKHTGRPVSVTAACEAIAKRGRVRRTGEGGGIRIKYPDGKIVHLDKTKTIKRWYDDALDALKSGDEYLLEVLKGRIQALQMQRYVTGLNYLSKLESAINKNDKS